MSLEPGARIGNYEVAALIGRGGMGEVYRARDRRLGREVALKVLSEALEQRGERLSRLEREAKLLASLSHPAIATLLGVEDHDGAPVLVMEFLGGESLADAIARTPMAVGEALPLFEQIADALAAAHDKGIVHRDLKPANIQRTAPDTIKILDFGLAKALAPEAPSLTSAPTRARDETRTGTVMGTPFYMSPEQARGLDVDKRTDVWAFGCVLYEALTGKKAFDGPTASDVLSAVLQNEPDWNALPPSIPGELQKLIRRCLVKEPRRRLHDLADARNEIEDLRRGSTSDVGPAPTRARRFGGFPLAVSLGLAFLAGLLAAGIASRRAPTPLEPIRFSMAIPEEERIGGLTNSVFEAPLAISPNGKTLAYVAEDDRRRIFVRRIDELKSRPVAGTEGGSGPFFSPDGARIGFLARDELRTVPVDGGTPSVLCKAPDSLFFGATWGPDDTIVFHSGGSGLLRVSASGGEVETITSIDPGGSVRLHHSPQFLPGGNEILFLVQRRPAVVSLDTKEIDLIEGLSVPEGTTDPRRDPVRYLPSGHLLRAQVNGQIIATPIDIDRRRATGSPSAVLDNVHMTFGIAYIAMSDSGTLAYVPTSTKQPALVTVSRSGNVQLLTDESIGADTHPRFSPDGTRVVADFGGAADRDLWITDVERATKTRVTMGGVHQNPAWAADGQSIAYAARNALRVVRADATGEHETLLEREGQVFTSDWSPDGRTITFHALHPQTGLDIWKIDVSDGSTAPIAATSFTEVGATFSPDGRFIAYTSDESGRFEVYVRSFPELDAKILVSTSGGSEPMWSGETNELFYRRGRQILAVPIQTAPDFSAGRPEVLFEGAFDLAPRGDQHYDVSPDGESFVMLRLQDINVINVTLNWLEELRRLAPTK